MSNDAILLAMSDSEFGRVVGDTLKNLERKPERLAVSPLALSSLVLDCLLDGEAPSLDLRLLGVRALMCWVIDKTRPHPNQTPDLNSLAWRTYAILHHHYWEGRRIRDLDVLLNLSESAVNQAVPVAELRATAILRDELRSPGHLTQRRKYLFRERYAAHHPEEQHLLRLLAVFDCPLPVAALQTCAKQAGVTSPEARIEPILAGGLALQDPATRLVCAHPEIVLTLVNLIDAEERCRSHSLAAEYFQQMHDYLTAAEHWRMAGNAAGGARLLIDHYRTIVEDGRVDEFYALQKKFHRHDLDHVTWARLKIATGRAQLLVGRVKAAREEFRKAQGTTDAYYQAEACYYHARASEKIYIAEAIALYDQAIDMLSPLVSDSDNRYRALLIQVHVDKAWVFIQESVNLEEAAQNLNIAQTLLTDRASESRCLLHTGWAGLHGRQRDYDQEERHLRVAWAAAGANEELSIMANHNLGQFYVLHRRQFSMGLDYLAQAHARASDIRNREWESKCKQAIGAAYFLMRNYDEAITNYKAAYETYRRIGNENWLGWVCWDLSEAYATKLDYEHARRYYTEAKELAPKVAAHALDNALKELDVRFPALVLTHDPLEAAVIEYVAKHGSISNAELQKLCGISRATATRVLNRLAELGLLERVGKGPATIYRRKMNDAGA